jgi:hypothetical protein
MGGGCKRLCFSFIRGILGALKIVVTGFPGGTEKLLRRGVELRSSRQITNLSYTYRENEDASGTAPGIHVKLD